jgi:hypothetical protein
LDNSHPRSLADASSPELAAPSDRSAASSADAVTRPVPAAGLLTMPSDWSPIAGPDFRGRVQFTRRFGCPTGILDDDRVDLVVDAVDYRAAIELNGRPLGETRWGAGPWRVAITTWLQPANELRITVELPAGELDRGERTGKPGGLIGEVRLEIHSQLEVHS